MELTQQVPAVRDWNGSTCHFQGHFLEEAFAWQWEVYTGDIEKDELLTMAASVKVREHWVRAEMESSLVYLKQRTCIGQKVLQMHSPVQQVKHISPFMCFLKVSYPRLCSRLWVLSGKQSRQTPCQQGAIVLEACCCQAVLRRVWLFATLWSVARQTPLSMGFTREEFWSGLHFLLQGILLTQGLNPGLPRLWHCRWILYCWATWEAHVLVGRQIKQINEYIVTQE